MLSDEGDTQTLVRRTSSVYTMTVSMAPSLDTVDNNYNGVGNGGYDNPTTEF